MSSRNKLIVFPKTAQKEGGNNKAMGFPPLCLHPVLYCNGTFRSDVISTRSSSGKSLEFAQEL